MNRLSLPLAAPSTANSPPSSTRKNSTPTTSSPSPKPPASKLATLMKNKDDPFSELDSKWYGDQALLRRKFLEFALAHPQHFGGQQEVPP